MDPVNTDVEMDPAHTSIQLTDTETKSEAQPQSSSSLYPTPDVQFQTQPDVNLVEDVVHPADASLEPVSTTQAPVLDNSAPFPATAIQDSPSHDQVVDGGTPDIGVQLFPTSISSADAGQPDIVYGSYDSQQQHQQGVIHDDQGPLEQGSESWFAWQSPEYYSKFKDRVGLESTCMGQSYAGDIVAVAEKEFAETKENYLRGCKWSPDGRSILTNSNDDMMRVFDITDDVITGTRDIQAELECSTRVQESELVYDYCWFPCMESTQPDTCCFATSCRDTPIHLYNSVTGSLVCTYRPYNNVDEIVAAHSICFTCDGRYLLSGFNKTIRIFHTARPGRDFIQRPTTVKDKRTQETKGQQGIISCFAAHPSDPAIFAAGSFRGDVALYSAPGGDMSSVFRGQQGGVTHMMFSSDGLRLYAGGRKTNQRMYFDLDSTNKFLLSGNHNGKVSVWDLETPPYDNPITSWPQVDPVINFQAHRDATNGCSVNPKCSLLATCSGQRHFPLDDIVSSDDDSDNSDEDDGDGDKTETDMEEVEENCLRVWRIKLS
ncbi:hypothetical protein BaRGS_00033248 [Batillaria attramentaria]|uniref:WD repeat-containing protein 79 n=1 Tax=Batillaria attramentaria TaxID=370345 RepID=A0ABD0JKE2_9CAEN